MPASSSSSLLLPSSEPSTTSTTSTTSAVPTRKKNLFTNVNWGSFKGQLKDYNGKHKSAKKKNLHSFSNYIIQHPSKFHSITRKRALFYKNVINHKKKSTENTKKSTKRYRNGTTKTTITRV
jgi:hypothetical protein